MAHHHAPRKLILTARQREVLAHVAQGMRNKEIGTALGIGERTVETLLARACERLGCNNRLAAAVRAGIVEVRT